jgi:thiamine-phosphate diphosphorylase
VAEIYAITDDILTPSSSILIKSKELLECGVKILQYRTKKPPDDQVAKSLIKICHQFDAKLIINDNIEYAAKVNADGVHIGKDDGEVRMARKILGNNAIIGVSCYNDINLAIKAQEFGASYVAFGAMFDSKTKQNAPKCDFGIVQKAKQILQIPICVIGGINASNISQILKLKPDLIAVISALYQPNSIKQNYKELVKNFNDPLG